MAHILGLVGDHVWQFDLLSHFVVQYAMVFLVVSAVHWRYRGFRAARSFVLLLLMMTVLAGVSWIPQPERRLDATVPRSERLRLASLNVLTENDRHAAVGARLAEIDADVLLLLEVSPAWLDGLGALRSTYPHRLEAPRRDNFGIALWSRVPWKSAELLDEGGEVVPSVRAVIPIGGRDVEVRGVHALPPVGARWSALRDRQILAVAQGALATHRPVVLAGDLNLTPWSAVFDRLTWSTGLRDTRRGFGVQATWPGYLPMPFRIPIDHVLVSRELAWRDRSVFEAPGSDHLGVVVDLGWRRPSSR